MNLVRRPLVQLFTMKENDVYSVCDTGDSEKIRVLRTGELCSFLFFKHDNTSNNLNRVFLYDSSFSKYAKQFRCFSNNSLVQPKFSFFKFTPNFEKNSNFDLKHG